MEREMLDTWTMIVSDTSVQLLPFQTFSHLETNLSSYIWHTSKGTHSGPHKSQWHLQTMQKFSNKMCAHNAVIRWCMYHVKDMDLFLVMMLSVSLRQPYVSSMKYPCFAMFYVITSLHAVRFMWNYITSVCHYEYTLTVVVQSVTLL